MSDLDKSRRPTFYYVWPCENCGFSNGLEVSKCGKCNQTMQKMGRTIYVEDEEKHVPVNLNCSYKSCQDEAMYGSTAINDYCETMRKEENFKEIRHAYDMHERCCMTRDFKNMEDMTKKHEDNAKSCISEQIYTKDLSEFKLPKEDSLQADLSLDTEFELYRLQCNLYSSTLQEKKGGEDDNRKILNCTQREEHTVKHCEDMEIVYHSNSSCGSMPSLPNSPLEEVGILGPHASTVMQMVDEVYKTKCDLNHVNLKDTSFASAFDSININGEAIVPATALEGLKQSEDSISLIGYKDLKYGNLRDQQVTTYVVLPKHTNFVREHANRESSYDVCPQTVSKHDQKNQQTMSELTSVYSAALTLQMTENELCIDTEGLNDNHILPVFESSRGLQNQIPAIKSTIFPLDNMEDTIPNIFEDSFHSVGSTNSSDDSHSENMFDFSFFVPGISINEDQCPFQDIGATADTSHEQVDCINREFNCLTCINRDSSCKLMVNQSVDATSDFRTCFTISRTTGMEASMVSRGDNTEITFNNCSKTKWQPENCRSVGCNTDYYSSIVKEVYSQTIWADDPENLIAAKLTPVNWKLPIKDSLNIENKEHDKNVKESTERIYELSNQAEKGQSFNHLQRAVKAELQLLCYHYWMCQQHCWSVYKLAMEEDCFSKRHGFTLIF
ncbi:RNA-binding protein 44-like [Rhinatrema bivittatum]|uniref:RNA-binding protein 44-like n=1 Tax=Rhinatrema bivittatum TaxID=194408 RepID=UPI00112975ED|nr:RNA-binding protein 44-like [Rhinatrema bivittatum]